MCSTQRMRECVYVGCLFVMRFEFWISSEMLVESWISSEMNSESLAQNALTPLTQRDEMDTL